jgi:hypothetical protein
MWTKLASEGEWEITNRRHNGVEIRSTPYDAISSEVAMAHGHNGQRSLYQLCLAHSPDHRIGQRCVPEQGGQKLRHSTGPFGATHRCDVYFLARGQVGHRRDNRPCTVPPAHGAISHCDQRSRSPWEIWLTLAGCSRPLCLARKAPPTSPNGLAHHLCDSCSKSLPAWHPIACRADALLMITFIITHVRQMTNDRSGLWHPEATGITNPCTCSLPPRAPIRDYLLFLPQSQA